MTEKRRVILTPESIMRLAEQHNLMIGRDQALQLIKNNIEWFRGRNLSREEVLNLIRYELGLGTLFDAAVDRSKTPERV